MNFRRRHQLLHQPGFNITPLLDILLVLIIFFILTWNFSRDEKELALKLPTASQGQDSRPRPGEIILNLAPDGSVVLNRRTLDHASLTEVLTQLAKEFPDQAVILRADKTVPYRHVVSLLDVCHAAKVHNVAFATAREDEQ